LSAAALWTVVIVFGFFRLLIKIQITGIIRDNGHDLCAVGI